MGHWEDFWWDVTESIDKAGLRKEFDAQLEKMSTQDKHRYKDTRAKWEYAHKKVIDAWQNKNTTDKKQES
tara:strand:+ start:1823 stop:2032 length:210 start_codon:yes stop_codon:yes gene_type:complete